MHDIVFWGTYLLFLEEDKQMLISIDTRGAKLYTGTGIGTYTNELMKNIMKLDQKNQYLFFWPGEGYEQFKGKSNIKVRIVGEKHKSFWTNSYIPAQIKNNAIEIFHVPQNGIGLPKEKYCKYVVTVHDLIPYILPETVGENYRKQFTTQMPSILENADKIITVSQYSKQDIMNYFGIPKEKIAVTYLATDTIYQPINHQHAKNFIKNRYTIDSNFILYLGGFSPRKNVHRLIDAYANIYRKLNPSHDLIIIGTLKESHQELVKQVEKLGLQNKVKFIGFIPYEHLPYFYNAASVFVYPSIYEGFGLPPLEAMACGCPTITSNITSIPEVVGDGALLINPFDIDELSRSILKILEDQKFTIHLIVKGLKRASNFSWKTTAMNTLKVYSSLR